ncbi:MAG: sulfatase [Verrucomicrobiota bacterium]
MRKVLFSIFLSACTPFFAFAQDEEAETPAEPAAPDTRPNLVLIIADDMNWDDCSPYGHDSIFTPNLQRMADQGMRFDNAYLTISSCSPSRASMITGMYPCNTDAEELHWPVPEDKITFVERLKESGYWTGAAGKWHLGEAMKARFDEVREVDTSGFQLPSGDAAKSGKFKETLEGEAQSGCADWEAMLKERPMDKPFFAWLAALDPHRPYHSNILDEPSKANEIKVPPYHPDTPVVRADYQLYYDEITRLDKYVGRVMDLLEAQGVADNTLVIFMSDNGRPFPRDKTTLFDSGIKTPFIAHWPNKVKAGTATDSLVSSIDISRTFMDIAGIEDPGPTFVGRSFLPILEDAKAPGREYVFAEKNWHDFEDHARMVRNKRYKYIRNYYTDIPLTPSADSARSGTYTEMLRLRDEGKLLPHQLACFSTPRAPEELYDTKNDPFELENLIENADYGSVILAMRAALKDWETRNEDSAPELRTADEFDRVTGLPTPARVRPRLDKATMVEKGLVAP